MNLHSIRAEINVNSQLAIISLTLARNVKPYLAKAKTIQHKPKLCHNYTAVFVVLKYVKTVVANLKSALKCWVRIDGVMHTSL